MGNQVTPHAIEEQEIFKEMGLNDKEYQKIKELIGLQPNYTERQIYSVMCSEDCNHETSRPVLKKFPKTSPAVLVGLGEGAGVVDIGDSEAVVFKRETHHCPSRINAYEGAATGVGGILR